MELPSFLGIPLRPPTVVRRLPIGYCTCNPGSLARVTCRHLNTFWLYVHLLFVMKSMLQMHYRIISDLGSICPAGNMSLVVGLFDLTLFFVHTEKKMTEFLESAKVRTSSS